MVESTKDQDEALSSSSNNVSVVLRLRPLVPHEVERGCEKVVHKVRTIESVLSQKQEDEDIVRVEMAPNLSQKASNNRELVKCFSLDSVLEEHDTQEDVYKKSGAYKAVSQDLFRGYHCTILAYGQSGSGKTYTMGTMADCDPASSDVNDSFTITGSESLDSEAGVIQRACHDLFQQVEEQCMGDATVELSYLEIYNEEIRDLLAKKTSRLSQSAANRMLQQRELQAKQMGAAFVSNNANGDLQIREDTNGEVFVQGKTSVVVESAEQVVNLMRRANSKRVVASTKLNEVSSRSHAICILTVTGTNSYDVTFQSRLTLVDLAGSERLSKTENIGWRAKEGISINVGLFVLGLVISALTETRPQHQRHPPYRESKLTRILQNSLGGNARTIMIACCSPTDYHAEETVNTLRYATAARNIKNPATANIVHDEHAEQVLALQSHNDQLQQTNDSLQMQISEYESLIRQISSELVHVKEHYQNTTHELSSVKEEYQTTSEQLMEIQEEFQATMDHMKKERIEDVLKKHNRRQKQRLANNERQKDHVYLYDDIFNDPENDELLLDPRQGTPTRSIASSLGESFLADNSVGTEPTADLTVATATVSPAGNRLVPPPALLPEDQEGPAETLVEDVTMEEEEEEEQEEVGEASVPEDVTPQEKQEESGSAQEPTEPVAQEEELPMGIASAEDHLSLPVSQVEHEEDQSQTVSLLTELQEWNPAPSSPLLGDFQTEDVSISKDMEDAAREQQAESAKESEELQDLQDLSEIGNSILADAHTSLQNDDSSVVTEVHQGLSTKVEEEKKEDCAEDDQTEGINNTSKTTCETAYQQCKTSTKGLYCQDSLVDKESEVMVEAVPISMPYNDLTGVTMPTRTSPSNMSTQGKSKEELNSLQSGTITQGSQATGASTGSAKRKNSFKRFLSNFNCMSGVYGRKDEPKSAPAANPHVERL